MGSIFSPRTPTPPPPPPPATYRDEIGGTEQVPVQNPDGTTTYITRQLPLTAEQQAEQDAYKQMMQDALSEIEQLSSSDYTPDKQTQSILNAWEAERQTLLDDNFDDRARAEEKQLARRGLGSSSAANAVRRERVSDVNEAQSQLARERELLTDNVRERNMAYQQNLYNLASAQQNMDEVKALQSASQGVSAVNAVNASNRASISDYYNRQVSASQNQGGLLGNTVGLFTGSLGSAFGNTVGGSIFNNSF